MSFGQASYSMPDFTGAEYIGDVEQNKILHKNIIGFDYYVITIDGKPVCFIQTQSKAILGKDYLEIENVFTEEPYRGKNLAKKLLFFLRNVEKKSFVMGDKQSKLGQDFIKSISKTSRFPMFWLNIKTNEKHPYNHDADYFTLKPYRSLEKPTDWVVIIEGTEKDWMSRFLATTPEQGGNWWERGIIWFE